MARFVVLALVEIFATPYRLIVAPIESNKALGHLGQVEACTVTHVVRVPFFIVLWGHSCIELAVYPLTKLFPCGSHQLLAFRRFADLVRTHRF